MAGQGAKLQSAWAWDGYGIHLPRKAVEYGDTDDAERAVWMDWFFEAVTGGMEILPSVGSLTLLGSAARMDFGITIPTQVDP